MKSQKIVSVFYAIVPTGEDALKRTKIETIRVGFRQLLLVHQFPKEVSYISKFLGIGACSRFS